MPEPVAQAAEPAAPMTIAEKIGVEKVGREKAADKPAAAEEAPKPQVVSLDAFRKRRD
jgi:hypothetical protein